MVQRDVPRLNMLIGLWFILSTVIYWSVAVDASNSDNIDTVFHNRQPITAWMSDLFNHYRWTTDSLRNVSHVCREHLATYLIELKRDNPWAINMNDASGRYNGQFFFGNDFWLGSSSLCAELTISNGDEEKIETPFLLHFYVAKVQLNLLEKNRQVMVGLCLPASCTQYDIASVMAQDATRANERVFNASVQVVSVRQVPGTYNFLEDTKFHIIGGVGVAVLLIVVIASIYEMYIIKKNTNSSNNEGIEESSTNNNNELKRIDRINNGKEKRIHIGVAGRLLLCFSASTNGRRILDMNTEDCSDTSIRCVHGLRFMSVTWVILVHTYLQVFAVGENKGLRAVTERSFLYQSISNATFSVDTFFFISGLLVTVLFMRSSATKRNSRTENENENVLVNGVNRFFLLVFYRLVRLTPAYLFVLGIHELAMRHLHNSSVFEPNLYDHETCSKYWWRNALYINTWYPQSEICMLWSWYMSNDTQFYILAIIFLIVAVQSNAHFKIIGALIIIVLLSSTTTTFLISYQYNYVVRIEEPFALFDQLYDKPWARIGPYLVGMVTGWLLHIYGDKVRVPRILATFGWLVALSCLGALVYGVGRSGIRLPLSGIYVSVGHSVWAIALAWITFACSRGQGGPVNTLLSFRGFLPFSRLTYCAYLLHPMLMCITTYQMDGPIHLHNGLVLVLYFGNVIIAFLLAFLISLGFEAPVVRLLKMLVTTKD